MAKRIIDYDPLTGMSTFFDYDHSTDTTIVSYEQDVSTILEENKKMQNCADLTKWGIKNDWWLYARYPAIVIQKWLNEYGVNVFDENHQKKVFELTNRPEYRYLKTTTKMDRG